MSNKSTNKLDHKFWADKRVLVTGGHGFVGKQVVALLSEVKPREVISPHSIDFDLREKDVCQELVQGVNVVIHLAANVGGIGYNQKYPGTLFYDNILMGVNLMEEARKAKVEKFVAIGTICAYPKFTPVPFREENLWNGYPEETNAPYGLAKKMMLVQAQAYRKQYNFNAVYLLPVNMYGPGDNFDPDSSHVVPALIRKFVQAKQDREKQVTVWGTGKATREFLYVVDAAWGILLAAEKYNGNEPINLGANFEISIQELAQTIAKVVGFQGEIVFDVSKPDGQPRRKLDVSRAKEFFGFEANTSFEKGLQQTIEWYRKRSANS